MSFNYRLVSDQEARQHLRIEDDERVSAYVSAAHAIVFEYVGAPLKSWTVQDDDPEYDKKVETLNRYDDVLTAAILMVLGELWLNRESTTANPLSDSVKNLLQVVKGPAYA